MWDYFLHKFNYISIAINYTTYIIIHYTYKTLKTIIIVLIIIIMVLIVNNSINSN